jgi:hypothetical protein
MDEPQAIFRPFWMRFKIRLCNWLVARIPTWVESFWSTTPYGGRMCGFLSLLDLGGDAIEIHPNYIWGLNFAIQRRALFDLGGFHPDCIPDALRHFQGNGETGLTMVLAQGYKAVFKPGPQCTISYPQVA